LLTVSKYALGYKKSWIEI